jgi:uncharacterized membrane protein (DUF106 family)
MSTNSNPAPTYLGLTHYELCDLIELGETLKPLMETKAYQEMLLRAQHEVALQRMIKAREDMHRLNAQIKKLGGR